MSDQNTVKFPFILRGDHACERMGLPDPALGDIEVITFAGNLDLVRELPGVAVQGATHALERSRTYLFHQVWERARTFLPADQWEHFARLVTAAVDVQLVYETAISEVAAMVGANLPSQLNTLDNMLDSAITGAGICCEAQADAICQRGFTTKDAELIPLYSPGFQIEWLTIAGAREGLTNEVLPPVSVYPR